MLEISREDAMIKRLIEYIILILLTIILFFLYDDEIVGMMLVMEIVYLPVSVIYKFVQIICKCTNEKFAACCRKK